MKDVFDRLVIRSNLSELERLFAFIDKFCSEQGVRNEIKYKLFLVAEELSVNVMVHGFQGRPDGTIEITLRLDNHQVEVCVVDEAPAFDPLRSAPEPVLDAHLEERQVGGLGVHLVRNMAQSLDYSFRDGRNEVRAIVSDGAGSDK
jgi:serine/threonine-protein kinase RsbW